MSRAGEASESRDNDAELLRRFCADGSEAAFAEILRRYLPLVYSVALRRVNGDAHLAEDVSQQAFIALAKRARSVRDGRCLSAWLHATACFIGRDAARGERRRREREQEAMMNREIENAGGEVNWEAARPMLDDALDSLKSRDRDAICLRYFERLPFESIGERLRVSENAARMRVNRSLDKLGEAMGRKGVRSSAAAIAAALTGQAGAVVPISLATKIAGSAASTLSAATAGFGIIHFMNTGKLIVSASALVAAVSAGVAVHQSRERSGAEEALSAALEESMADRRRAEELELRLAELERRAELVEAGGTANAAASTDSQSSSEPITEESVRARLERARAHAKEGRLEAALDDYLWCFEVGMPEVPSYMGVRSALVIEMGRLGDSLPAAKQTLVQLRNEIEARLREGKALGRDVGVLVPLNTALGEESRSLELYDSIPNETDRRKLQIYLTEQLAKAGRYAEAASSARLPMMKAMYEMSTSRSAPETVAEDQREEWIQTQRARAAERAALNVEILAGAGRVDEAVELGALVLSFDDSEETSALLRASLERAGEGGLFEVMREE